MKRLWNQGLAALLLSAVFVVGAPSASTAQESRATLTGTIKDNTDAVLPGASVELVAVQTGVTQRTVTNAQGLYRFVFLDPADYELRVEMPGFQRFVRSNIRLQVGLAAVIDVVMQLGEIAETITVSSESPLLEADRGDRGHVVDRRTIEDLPVFLNNPVLLGNVAAGITYSGSPQFSGPFSNSAISGWSISGGAQRNVEFQLDGAPNNVVRTTGNNVAVVPPIDAVEEFRVMTTPYDASLGRTSGGVISMSIRAGTNQWRGSAYDFLKRTNLNANSFPNIVRGEPKQGNTLDQWGGTFGGPIVRNRTFFFASYESYDEITHYPQETISTVPTALMRQGDFSQHFNANGQLIVIYDPLTGRMENGQWVRDPFPGNRIPLDRMSPVGLAMMNAYPLPNYSAPGSLDWQNNFFSDDNDGWFGFHNWVARVDHNVNDNQRLTFRYAWNNFTQLRNESGIPGAGGNWRWGRRGNPLNVVGDSVTMLTPSTVLNVKGSATYMVSDFNPYIQGDHLRDLGFPESLVSQLARPDTFPLVSVGGLRGLGQGAQNNLYETSLIVSFQSNIVHHRGRHTFRAGVDYRRTRHIIQQPQGGAGSYNFTDAFTRRNFQVAEADSGSAVASLLLGYPGSGQANNVVYPELRWTYLAPWVQHDFRATSKLTINVGLRWDLSLPVTDSENRANYGFFADRVNPISDQIDQTRFPGFVAYGGIGFAGVDGNPRSPYATDWNNIQPRASLAYRLNDRTVLRGGYGIYYESPAFGPQIFGFSQATPYVSSTDAGRTPANRVDNPFPDGLLQPEGVALGMRAQLGQSPTFINPDHKMPFVHQFSAGIQRELIPTVVLDVSYVGSRGGAQPLSRAMNDLPADVLALGNPELGGNPNYLTQAVPNPFEGLLPGTSFNGATIPRQQLLRPFPQFGAFSMTQANLGHRWYNSLQVSATKRYSHGLAFTAAYTLSATYEDSFLNSQDPEPTRVLTASDHRHRLVLSPSYELPIGRGRRWLGGDGYGAGMRVLQHALGGWQITGQIVIQDGTPMSIPGNVYLIGDPKLDNPTWDRLFKTGYIDLNGNVHNVLPGEDPVFQIRPVNSLRTTNLRYDHIRNREVPNVDLSLIKNNRIRNGWNLQFRVDAFNALNVVARTGNPNTTPTSSDFGRINVETTQNNLPRTIQLGVRLSF